MRYLLIALLLFIGCDDMNYLFPDDYKFFQINPQFSQDINGYYHVTYISDSLNSPYSYQLSYDANKPVNWIIDNNNEWKEIISYEGIHFDYHVPLGLAPYTDDTGYGNWGDGYNSFYLEEKMIGDTLKVMGYIDSEHWHAILLIVH